MSEELILPQDVEVVDDDPVPGVDPKEAPCEIHLKSGKVFIVPKVAAWCYIPQGIFATGHFKGYSGEVNIIVNPDEIEYQQIDFDSLARYHERAADGA